MRQCRPIYMAAFFLFFLIQEHAQAQQTCTSLQQEIIGLETSIRRLQTELSNAATSAKAGLAAQITADNAKVAAAQAALSNCSNLLQKGSIYPTYIVITLLYAPPGIGSEASYGSGSTTGNTVDISNTFKPGLSFSTSGGFFGNDIDGSLSVSGGPKTGTSWDVQKETISTLSLKSQIDNIDHSRDVFYVWLKSTGRSATKPGPKHHARSRCQRR